MALQRSRQSAAKVLTVRAPPKPMTMTDAGYRGHNARGMASPDHFAGEVTKALADAGIFRLRAVLISSVAFSCYPGLLSVRLPNTVMQTGHADFAKDFAIAARVEDSLPPILEVLQSVDTTFRAVPHQADKEKISAFTNAVNYRVVS